MKKKSLRIILFVILSAVIWFFGARLLRYKESYYFKDVFYEDPSPYDVLFFGASYPHNAFDPAVFWDEEGISSYNLSMSGEPVSLTLFSVRSALEVSDPSLIVLDAGKITDDPGSDHVHIGESHKTLDAIPFGNVKREAVRYLMDTGVIDEPLDLMSSMWAYHDRVYSLSGYDLLIPDSHALGWDMNLNMKKTDRPVPDGVTRKTLENGEGVKAFKEIMDLCENKKIKLLLVALPWSEKTYRSKIPLFNSLSDLALSRGFDALDLNALTEETGLDYDYDLTKTSHLNAMGASGISEYLASYIKDRYGIRDRRGEEISALFEKNRRKRTDEILTFLKAEDNAVRFLMASKDKNLGTELYVRDRSIIHGIYGMDKVTGYCDAEVIEAGDKDIPEGSDVRVIVYDKRTPDNKIAVIKDFRSNPGEGILTVSGRAVKGVNYFPEEND